MNDRLSAFVLLDANESATRGSVFERKSRFVDFCEGTSEDLISERISILLNNGQYEESWPEKYDSVSSRKNEMVVNNRTFLLLLRIEEKLLDKVILFRSADNLFLNNKKKNSGSSNSYVSARGYSFLDVP